MDKEEKKIVLQKENRVWALFIALIFAYFALDMISEFMKKSVESALNFETKDLNLFQTLLLCFCAVGLMITVAYSLGIPIYKIESL